MGILEHFEINTNNQFICTLASSFGVGKTSVMVMLATELAKQGKTILYIGEEPQWVIGQKFARTDIKDYKSGKIHLFSGSYPSKSVETVIKNPDLDYVFIDSPAMNDNLLTFDVINFVKSNNISIFVSEQTKRRIEGERNEYPTKSIKLIQISDVVMTMSRITSWTFLEKLKNCLGIKKLKNTKFDCFKNRFGKQKTIILHLDYENLKIK